MPGRLTGKRGLRAFLLRNLGQIVTTEQLREASGNQGQYGRRLRELREDEGWRIESHNDAPDLKPGEYRLTERPPVNPPRFARGISSGLRAQVLTRNGFTCQMCGVGPGDTDPTTGRKVRLQVDHILDRAAGGGDELGNLRTLCSTCNQGARNLTQEPPSWLFLLGQLRRARVSDLEMAREWIDRRLGRDGQPPEEQGEEAQ